MIETLVQDIYLVLSTPTEVPKDQADAFGHNLANFISSKLSEAPRPATLRMSNLGSKCKRQLWYNVHGYQGEPLLPQTRLKFLFGDILEHLLLFLSKLAGHDVKGEQDTLTISGVQGHRDAVIDGVTIDAKSASSRSFKKFQEGLKPEDDAFGYIDQLGAYGFAGQNDPIVTDKTQAGFLVVDKQFGHLALDLHPKTDKDYDKDVQRTQKILLLPNPPARPVFDEPEGKSGNRKIPTICSYCQHRFTCWPGLRTFLYSSGPVYLTTIHRLPNVPEIRTQDVPPEED